MKSVLAVIVGYIVMTITAFALLCLAYLGMGIERVFAPASYVASTLWMANMVTATLIGGIIGGWLCAALSKNKRTCQVFAGIVLALGLLVAILAAMKEHPSAVRSGDVPNFQAMQMARTPAWILFLNPVLGAAGVLLGARMKRLPAA